MARVQVDERRDALLPAVLIDGVGIVSGIQEELPDAEFRKVRLHGEEGMQEREHVMPGGPLQKWEYREVAAGIGCHVHVEVVAEEIAFPVGVPAPVAVRLGIAAPAMAGATALFPAVAEPLLTLLCGGADGRAVTGKCQMCRIDQASADGLVQELLLVEPEDKGERIPWLQAPAFQQRKEPGSRAGRITGSLLAFLLPLGRLHLREAVFWGKVAGAILPDAGKEIIKSPYTRGIPGRETAEDGVERGLPEHAAPDSDGGDLQLQGEQVGAQHAGREPWWRAKDRVTVPHDGIRLGKVEVPELHDIVPGAFGKHKGIGVGLKEVGYESILVGGMSARVTR